MNRLTIFIGENNSGKSNLLKAITLPFFNDEIGNINKNLGWHDINNLAKARYFEFIVENLEHFKNGTVVVNEFIKVIPFVKVEVNFTPDGTDEYYVRRWINSINQEAPQYTIKYQYEIDNPIKLFEHVSKILSQNDSIDKIKMNLLPIELYKYSILIPLTKESVTFNDLANFRYNALAAERDEFSNKNTQLGSKALVNLLQNKLSEVQKVEVEKSYETFFEELKKISNLENIFNWQEYSNMDNAKEFFEKINLLPNMPSMSSLLNNVRARFWRGIFKYTRTRI